MRSLLCVGLFAFAVGCHETSPEQLMAATPDKKSAATPASKAVASMLGGQRGKGQPYEIVGSEVWNVPDPLSGRNY
ncbi:MAG TPA: alpha/beta hydrolase, partial [Lysobacter sp.]